LVDILDELNKKFLNHIHQLCWVHVSYIRFSLWQ